MLSKLKMFCETISDNHNDSILPNLATLKLEILAHWVEISYGQILFLESLILDEVRNKIWPYEISTQCARISILKVAELGKIL